MNGNDSLRHIEVFAAFQTCVFHHFFKLVLLGVHTYGFGQIAITLFIFGDQLADLGQQLEGIKIVHFFGDFIDGMRKLQHDNATTRL